MKSAKVKLSLNRIAYLRAQGYKDQTDQEIKDLAFGNRFAYQLCTSILLIGVLTSNIPVLAAMMTIAFASIILPNHPFDYIYNYFLAKRMNKPQLPSRSKQLKFTCTIATLWIGATIYLIHLEMNFAARIMGLSLVGVAFLVSTTDYCIPSVIYNATLGKLPTSKSN